jgi:hypothetical protein
MKLSCIGDSVACGLGARDARRARQAAEVGRQVEVVAHAQLAVVAGVQHALRQPAVQRGHAGARQVVGVDVVGVDVVLGRQHRRAALQALARVAAGAVAGVDAGHAQDVTAAPLRGRTSAAGLGIDAAPRAVGGGRHGARLVEAAPPQSPYTPVVLA